MPRPEPSSEALEQSWTVKNRRRRASVPLCVGPRGPREGQFGSASRDRRFRRLLERESGATWSLVAGRPDGVSPWRPVSRVTGSGHLFAGRVQGDRQGVASLQRQERKGSEQHSEGRTCCVIQNSTQCCAIASNLALSNIGLSRSSHLSSPHPVVLVLVLVKCRVLGRAHVVSSDQHSRRNARTSAAISMGGGVRTRRAVAQDPNACGVGRGRAKASETARGRRDDAQPAGRRIEVVPRGIACNVWCRERRVAM